MTQLSQPKKAILTELYYAADGEVGMFFPVLMTDMPIIEALLHQGLLELEVEESDSDEQWFAALTKQGAETAQKLIEQDNAEALNQLVEQNTAVVQPVIEQNIYHVTIPFDISNSDEAALVQQLSDLSNGNINGLLGHLFTLHEALERGDFETLITSYPEASDTIRQMVQGAIESHLMTHEQQRIEKLSDEIHSMKAMLTERPAQNNGTAPSIKPMAGLQPLQTVPTAPFAQPKQIKAPIFDVPVYDEEDDSNLFVVEKDEDAGRRASENFLQSLQNLQD